MKKVIVFLLLLLQSVILPQNSFIRQITNGDFDVRNPFIYKNEYSFYPTPLFFELHKSGYSNIYSVSYNTGTALFEDTVALTFGTDLNINPSFENNSGLLYQTNKNGNWDIALLPDSNGNWRTLKYLTNSLSDETEPKFFESTNSFQDSVNILFKRDDKIVHLSHNQNQITEETVFQNSLEFTYTEFVGLDFLGWTPSDGLYAFAIEQDNSNQKRIVRKYKPTGSEWQEKVIIKDSCDCSGLSLQVSVYIVWGLFYLDSLQGQRRYYMVEDPISIHSITPLQIDYEGNLSSFEMYSLLIVGKNLNKEMLDPPFYMPYTYLLENNGETKVRINQIDFGNWWSDSLVQVSVINPNLAVGPVGLEYNGLVVYTVWEDSIDGNIQLFGIPAHLGYGAVNDESIANNFVLYQNYPNPFNPNTKIEYKLLQASDVKFNVFNILGEKVFEQNYGYQTAGSYKINFDGVNLPSGVYVYSIYTSENRLSRKMLLLR